MTQRAPRFTPGRYLLGHAYLGLNRPDQAVAEFKEVVAQDPGNVLGRYSLATAYMLLEGKCRVPGVYRKRFRPGRDWLGHSLSGNVSDVAFE
jgi:Tfp pilus assembly protein PilF